VQTIPNVIIFGEAGVGKSSLVNLILGAHKAKVNANAGGCTFESTSYSVQIEGKIYNLYDTAGLDEASGGTVDRRKAIVNLYKLVSKLAKTGGVNLLIFVVKCGRLSHSVEKNYDMFHQAICEAEVPIVIVVTNCENTVSSDDPDQTMDSWWDQNEERFERAGLRFKDHACVCASRGRKLKNGTYSNDEPFEDSKGKVDAVIHQCCLSNGWSKVSHLHRSGR
jgi:predicted GTPase